MTTTAIQAVAVAVAMTTTAIQAVAVAVAMTTTVLWIDSASQTV